MKCKQCGGNLSIQDEKCPYCLTPNGHYRQHRAEMFRFRKDYERTKEQVIRKSGKYAGLTVKIALIAVLAFLDILFIFLGVKGWEIASFLETVQLRKETEVHRNRLESYEQQRDYLGLAVYYSEHNLYQLEELEEFRRVYQVCSNYSYVYQNLVELGGKEDYQTDIERIEYISDGLNYLYDAMEVKDYEPKSYYAGEHGELLEDLEEDLKLLLCAFTHISMDEAENFPHLSDGRRQVAMERGLGLNED